MFTNVPFKFVKEIIFNNYDAIAEETSVPVGLFMEALQFLIEESCFFIFNGEIYKQLKGLTMGNTLSQMLADIGTNYITMEAVDNTNGNDISYLFKYIDDFSGLILESIAVSFENELTGPIGGLTLKRTNETQQQQNLEFSSTFLDVIIIRNAEEGVNIKTRWWQKGCSARRILNFHSFHQLQLKRNIVTEYTRHAIHITSPEYMHMTIKGLRSVFRRSSYPSNFTEPIIKNFLNILGGIHIVSMVGSPDESFDIEKEINIKQTIQNKKNNTDGGRKRKQKHQPNHTEKKKKYISLPTHNWKVLNRMNYIAKNNNINCCFAPSPLINNGKEVFSKLKDRLSTSSVRFAIFCLKCKNCKFRKYFRTFNLDVWRSAKHNLNRKQSALTEHKDENPGHEFMKNPEIFKKFNNAFDLELAFSRM